MGLKKRFQNKSIPKQYIERLQYELNIIHQMGFDDYFLIVWDYVRYAKINKILVGPGRGSAAGSLVAYVLGITNVDPLQYDLLFERFLNPERVSMPDIDIDFQDDRRDEVVDYVIQKFGLDPNKVLQSAKKNLFALKYSEQETTAIQALLDGGLDTFKGANGKKIGKAQLKKIVSFCRKGSPTGVIENYLRNEGIIK